MVDSRLYRELYREAAALLTWWEKKGKERYGSNDAKLPKNEWQEYLVETDDEIRAQEEKLRERGVPVARIEMRIDTAT